MTSYLRLAALALAALLPMTAAAAPFTPGNIVVCRVGTGTGNLVNTGNAVFLDEFTPAGALVQSIALPTTNSLPQRSLIQSGTASSEGLISRSADNAFIVVAGYNATPGGGTNLTNSTSAAINRVVGRIAADGTIDTTTALTDAASGNNVRSATSATGAEFWVAGGGGGVRYATLGGTTSVQLNGDSTINRQLHVIAGQLYASTGSGTNTFKGVDTVGTGLPVTGGQTFTRLPGLTDSLNNSTYQFVFFDLDAGVAGNDVLYVADDSTTAGALGGIAKFSLVGGTWVSNGRTGLAGDTYRGLTGTVSGGVVTLFATRKGGTTASGGGELVSLTDNTGYNVGIGAPTITLLATAAVNTAFRGVALAPIGSQPDLVVNVAAPANASVGVPFTYTLTASNQGTTPATGVTVQFTLPAGLAYVGSAGNQGFTGSESGGVVTFSGGSLALGSPATLTVDVTAAATGTVMVAAGAASIDPANTVAESNEGNNSSTATPSTEVVKGATPTPSPTPTPTVTPTPTPSPTPTITPTPTLTPTPTITPTPTPTPHPVGQFGAGNVVIYRVGTGSGPLVNTGNVVFLDEYTPTGSLVQSVPLPSAPNGLHFPLIASGTATSEGLLTRSADGRYLLATGYGVTTGGAPVAASSSADVPRVLGRIGADASIDTTTALSDFADTDNPRSAASVDGSAFWAAGSGSGIRYAPLGATTSAQLTATVFNFREVLTVDGQLYAASTSGTNANKGVNTIGTGLPTTAGQTATRLPGLTDAANPATSAFFFADLDSGVAGVDTLYVADEGAGALSKFSLVGGTWVPNGTIGVSGDSYRGLTGVVTKGNIVTLFATRKGGQGATGGGEFVTFTDASGYNGTFAGSPVLRATAPTNTAFRGIALAPVDKGGPTPTPTPTVTPTPTATPTPTPTPTVTPTPTPTPVAGTLSASTSQGRFIDIAHATILSQCSDPNSLPLTIISAGPTSAQGGVITLNASTVRYAPPSPQFTGADSFSYTIQNTAGATASGIINVTVNSPDYPPNAVVVVRDGGGFTASFNGVPGLTYIIEYTDVLPVVIWTQLTPPGTATADSNGLFQFTDPTVIPRRFYRARPAP